MPVGAIYNRGMLNPTSILNIKKHMTHMQLDLALIITLTRQIYINREN